MYLTLNTVLEFAECGCLMELEHFDDPIPVVPRRVVKCIAYDMFMALEYRMFYDFFLFLFDLLCSCTAKYSSS